MQTFVIKPQRNELCQWPVSLENISKLQIRLYSSLHLEVSPRDPEISAADPATAFSTPDSCIFINLYFLLHYIASIFYDEHVSVLFCQQYSHHSMECGILQ